MAGILGYLAALADDIGTIAGKTMAGATTNLSGSLNNSSAMLDDIATYTKVASAKTSGVVVDDLAAIANMTNETTSKLLTAQIKKANSVDELKSNIKNMEHKKRAEIEKELLALKEQIVSNAKRDAAARELPIVAKIAKGSFINKLIIIPLIILINLLAPFLMKPILIVGGLYLAYEGCESVIEKVFGHHEEQSQEGGTQGLSAEKFENIKVKSAIKTDFILSLEIMVLTLSLLSDTTFLIKIATLSIVAIIATVGVYGLVALIIKLDDIGFFLQSKRGKMLQAFGNFLIRIVPYLVKAISIIGTIAMLVVGGGIVAHQIGLTHTLEHFLAHFGGFEFLLTIILEALFGLILGYIVVALMPFFTWIQKKIFQ